MGRRGPKPKRAALKVLEGNPGKRALSMPAAGGAPEAGTPSMPAWMDREAKAEWRRAVKYLKQMARMYKCDRASLVAYCVAWSEMVSATAEIDEHGATTITDKGNVIQRPEVGIRHKAMDTVLKFAKEFGLTPGARGNEGDAGPVVDEFAEYMARKKG